jgi:hypothetical protein
MENIEIKRCLQIFLGKLEMEEDKIRVLICRLAQLEQELDIIVENSSEGTSGTDVEVVILDGTRFGCLISKNLFFLIFNGIKLYR